MNRRSFLRALSAFSISGATLTACTNREISHSLPKARIIGDSISRGYTPYVKEILEGKVEVSRSDSRDIVRPDGKMVVSYTSREVDAQLDYYLGSSPLDVVHVNLGIWDATGKSRRSVEDYQVNLKRIIGRIRRAQPKCKIIWARCTPVEASASHLSDSTERLIEFNDAADGIMAELGITRIDDLYKAATDEKLVRMDGTHYALKDYEILATYVAAAIDAALAE